jgi:hypothetical protein
VFIDRPSVSHQSLFPTMPCFNDTDNVLFFLFTGPVLLLRSSILFRRTRRFHIRNHFIKHNAHD